VLSRRQSVFSPTPSARRSTDHHRMELPQELDARGEDAEALVLGAVVYAAVRLANRDSHQH
jgi:hypothetical protein